MGNWDPRPSIRLAVSPYDLSDQTGVISWPDKMELELTGFYPNRPFSLPSVNLHLESDQIMSNDEIRSLVDFQRAVDVRYFSLPKIVVLIAHTQREHWEFNNCRNVKLDVHNKTVERPPVIGQNKPQKMLVPTGWIADISFSFESYTIESRKNPALRIEPAKRFEIATDISIGDKIDDIH